MLQNFNPDRSSAGANRDRRPAMQTVAAWPAAVTAAGIALVSSADAAAQRTALGLGSAAEGDASDYAGATHSHAGTEVSVNPAGWSGFLAGCPATDVQGVLDWIDANK